MAFVAVENVDLIYGGKALEDESQSTLALSDASLSMVPSREWLELKLA